MRRHTWLPLLLLALFVLAWASYAGAMVKHQVPRFDLIEICMLRMSLERDLSVKSVYLAARQECVQRVDEQLANREERGDE